MTPIKKTAGYSGTPLVKKLGLKDGQRIMFVDEPAGFSESLGADMPACAPITRGSKLDILLYFLKRRTELERVCANAPATLTANGALWVAWPKKASGVPTDITENVIREVALPLGLVDIKVCAIDETWSGLKLVIRRENRKK